MATIYHIRKPLRRARGNQYYRDDSNRGQGTYCGASETEFDIPHRDKAVTWFGKNGAYAACVKCIMARAEI